MTMEDSGFLVDRKYLLHDHDSKYCSSFRQVIEAGSVQTLALPPRSPNLNAYAERWVRSVREECLAKLPTQAVRGEQEKVRCRERLGGLLKYYEREAA